MQVVTQVYLFRNPYTICYINEEVVVLANDELYKVLNLNQKTYPEKENEVSSDIVRKRLRLVVGAYFLGPFLKECCNSEAYRHNVVERFKNISGHDSGTVFLKLILEPPDQEIIDYSWNEKIQKLVWTRVEIENAFSWLSTLGGAYSALGDYFEECERSSAWRSKDGPPRDGFRAGDRDRYPPRRDDRDGPRRDDRDGPRRDDRDGPRRDDRDGPRRDDRDGPRRDDRDGPRRDDRDGPRRDDRDGPRRDDRDRRPPPRRDEKPRDADDDEWQPVTRR